MTCYIYSNCGQLQVFVQTAHPHFMSGFLLTDIMSGTKKVREWLNEPSLWIYCKHHAFRKQMLHVLGLNIVPESTEETFASFT